MLGLAGVMAPAFAADNGASGPNPDTLLKAGQDDANWILPAKTSSGNRFTGLRQIDKSNVAALSQSWRTAIADNGEQEAAPIIWNGTMYLSTPHEGVLALDARNGKLRWQSPYNPTYVPWLPTSTRTRSSSAQAAGITARSVWSAPLRLARPN